ncbi:MAG: hypothetical protein MP439_02800 [Ferrimicrobium sp.]|nr:hypothetical protein [Ferrimicrobium sp.]
MSQFRMKFAIDRLIVHATSARRCHAATPLAADQIRWQSLASQRRAAVLCGLVLSGLTLAACGSAGSSSGGATSVQSSANGSKVTVKSNNGTATFGFGVTLPSGFPSSVPVPSGIKLSASVATKKSGMNGYLLTYSFTGSANSLVGAYNQRPSQAGFSRQSSESYAGGETQDWTSTSWAVALIASAASNGQPGSLILTVSVPVTP